MMVESVDDPKVLFMIYLEKIDDAGVLVQVSCQRPGREMEYMGRAYIFSDSTLQVTIPLEVKDG